MTTTTDPDGPPPRRRRTLAVLAGVTAVALTGLAALGVRGLATVTGEADPAGDRQAEVAARGRQVMPFDLDRTTHIFAERPEGGVQTVVADDPADTRQVTLVRGHLRAEAERFARGDFTDPTTIHGPSMPGLAQLRDGAERVRVTYQELPDGARIRYATGDPALVDALHAWFRAQTSDHGHHAEHATS